MPRPRPGKLNAVMTPHAPIGCHASIMRCGALGGDREAVELSRKADGEIADVDHLLHFAETLGDDLADFDGDECAQGVLLGAKFLSQKTHELAPPRRGDIAPGEEGAVRLLGDRGHVVDRRLADAGDLGTVDRRADRQRAAQ